MAMMRVDVAGPRTPATVDSALAQSRLGDDDEREARHTALMDEVQDKLGKLGDKGITKPKDALMFVRNLQTRGFPRVTQVRPLEYLFI